MNRRITNNRLGDCLGEETFFFAGFLRGAGFFFGFDVFDAILGPLSG